MLAESGTLAERLKDAKDWLFRRGAHSHMVKDLTVYGQVTRLTSGPNRGALLFRGAAYPWATTDQAMAMNSTTISGEIWQHNHHGGRKQFVGVSRVARTALPYENVLADADEAPLDDEAMSIVVCDPITGVCEPCGEVTGDGAGDALPPINNTTFTIDHNVQSTWNGPLNPDGTPDESALQVIRTSERPVLAEVEQPEFDAQTNRITAIEERLDRFESMLSSFIISQTSGDDLAVNNRVDNLNERLPLIEQTLVDLREQLERLSGPTGATATDEPNPLTVNT